VFKAHIRVYHSTLGLRVINKKKKHTVQALPDVAGADDYQPVPFQLVHRCLPKRGAIHALDQPVFILLS